MQFAFYLGLFTSKKQKDIVNKMFTIGFRKLSVSNIIFVYRNN